MKRTKRKLLQLCCMLIFVIAGSFNKVQAQYSIMAYQPPLNFTHLDLWHFNISGIHDSTLVQFYVSLKIFDASNSTLLVKSRSSEFNMDNANLYVTPVNLGALSPLAVSYTVDAFYSNIVNSGGLFPAGDYQLEYNLFGRPTDGQYIELAEYSLNVNVENLWPPTLIYPEDTICEQNPVFTWTPSYQPNSGSQLTYNFRLVEILEYQTPYQAIVSNPAYYSEDNIYVTMLNYPISASQLVFGQEYAWQVDAVVNGQVTATSEIATFVYGCPADTIVDSIPKPGFYIKMKTEDYNGIHEMTNKYLPLAYEERYHIEPNTKLQYRVYDYQSLRPVNTHNYELDVKKGWNYYMFNVCGDGADLEDGVYIFEVVDNVGIKWYTLFEKRNINCN